MFSRARVALRRIGKALIARYPYPTPLTPLKLFSLSTAMLCARRRRTHFDPAQPLVLTPRAYCPWTTLGGGPSASPQSFPCCTRAPPF